MEPTYGELKAKIARLEAERAKDELKARLAKFVAEHAKPAPLVSSPVASRRQAAFRPTDANRQNLLTPAQRRAKKIMFWWYVTLGVCLYAIVQLTVELGLKGLFIGVGIAIVWNFVYWTKDTHFIH